MGNFLGSQHYPVVSFNSGSGDALQDILTSCPSRSEGIWSKEQVWFLTLVQEILYLLIKVTIIQYYCTEGNHSCAGS